MADILFIKSGVSFEMYRQIKNKIASAEHIGKDLYIILETTGGIPLAAIKTMAFLNAKYNKLYAVVYDMAMSAGTLMTLGCDEIYMYNDSCLGPLDLQIQHPNDSDANISTLDVRDTMLSISAQTSVIVEQFTEENKNRGMSNTNAAKISYDAAIKLMSPIVSKIDPYKYRESWRNSEVGSTYGARLLYSRMLKNNPALAIAISNKLANDYISHDYAIMMPEAKGLGLKVNDICSLPPNIRCAVEKKIKDAGYLFDSDSKNMIDFIQIMDDNENNELTTSTAKKEHKK